MLRALALAAFVAGAFLSASAGSALADRDDRSSFDRDDGDWFSMQDRVGRTYDSDRKRRVTKPQYKSSQYKSVKKSRSAYPNSAWGPFAGPPGLF